MEKKQIAKAIINVMKEVRGMEKNSNVGAGRNAYNGTKDQDVKEVFNDALSKTGLCMVPIDIDESTQVDRWDALDYNGKPTQKQSVFTKVKVKYLLLHTSGESQEIAGYGHGVDPQDKGAGKATTYAMKNALLYTFLTPVGKIDDTETTHSNDIATPSPAPKKKEIVKIDLPKEDAEKLLNGATTKEELTIRWRSLSPKNQEELEMFAKKKGEELKELK